MTRRLILTLLFAALSAFAHADGRAPVPAFEHLAQFKRNHALIEALVDSGVRLAQEEDALARADACTQVARRFADEIQSAAEQHDAARAAEVGARLYDLLQKAVAPNLQVARQTIPVGSTEERKLNEVSQQAMTLLQPFRSALRNAALGEEGEVRTILEDLSRRQLDLEKGLNRSPTRQLD